jgi:hypothetical protein
MVDKLRRELIMAKPQTIEGEKPSPRPPSRPDPFKPENR